MFTELPKAETVEAIEALLPGNLAEDQLINIKPTYNMVGAFPSLPYIEFLIDGNSEITFGAIASIPCAVTATDEDQCLAMLVRRDGETLGQLLIRLDRAIEIAAEDEIFINEIINGPDDRL